VTVAVIGGGFAGIAAGVELARTGIDDFVIFEQSTGVGGTWFDNRYPGAEVDTPSHMYSFSFKHYDWSRPFAGQEELERYLNETVDDHGIRDHFQFGVRIASVEWLDDSQRYLLRTSAGEELYFDTVISAVGFLNVPKIPDWPGAAGFEGPIVHTSRYDTSLDLTGKTVAVVGTGSSAAQVTPAIAPLVDKLYVFQRQPGWLKPKGENVYTPEQRAELRKRLVRFRARFGMFWQREKLFLGGRVLRPGGPADVAARASAVAYMAEVFADRPDLIAALTPDFPFMGKRAIQSSTYFPAFLRENVELVPQAVAALTPTGIIDAQGVERRVDVVIVATGFHAADYLSQLPVVGRNGRTIKEIWNGEPMAYLGSMVPGIPNFFMLYGPNTNHYAVVFNIEAQVRFAVRAIRRLRRSRAGAIEVRPGWYRRFNEWIGTRFPPTTVRNYFTAPSGRNVTQWPDGITPYWLLTTLTPEISTTLSGRPSTTHHAAADPHRIEQTHG
jgi:cation diffusion facilitator CzcD-associated flavoprotein CzcO